ncbi:MAG: hypothetical protein ACRDH5_02155 [bacterium]
MHEDAQAGRGGTPGLGSGVSRGGGDAGERTRPPERRRHTRRLVPGLAGRIGHAQVFRIVDVSPLGARIATGEALAPGRHYLFELAGLRLAATVLRCALVGFDPDEAGARPTFEAAILFDPLPPSHRKDLRRALAPSRSKGDLAPLALRTTRAAAWLPPWPREVT